ncbi:hypothetical protein DL93DRAFT_2110170 [Clavulina sp. PMI_390]|nr:hypothetical protein DL93DRAFT_2110170 [Clavulina sp. PMI_390]
MLRARRFPPRPPRDANGASDHPVDSQSLSAHHQRGRVRAIISACFIGILFLLVSSKRARHARLPIIYAVCAKEGAQIYTVDAENSNVACIVVSDDIIVDRGSLKDVRRRWGDRDTTGPAIEPADPANNPRSGTKIFYLRPGEALYPGFTDAHAHILGYGEAMQLQLQDASSATSAVQKVLAYVESHDDVLKDPSQWITGQGWNQNAWDDQSYPSAADLNVELLIGRPIALYRVDVHAMWVSDKVIELLGPLPETVEGGEIVRDAKGKPTGIFVDNAMLLVEAIKPAWSDQQLFAGFSTAMNDALRFGLTSIHDASSFPFMIEFFRKMADQGLLPLRIYPMAHLDDGSYWGDQFERFDHPSGRLNVRSVKLFTDGALGSFGAALLEPYSDNPATSGTLIYPEHVITSMVHDFVANGWQTNVHCIGDRANHIVLNAFEAALQTSNATSSGRHRIEHAQIIPLEDLPRFAELGLIASMQPTHATSDMGYAEQRLGPERIKGAYAWQSLAKTGAHLALGSDAPVESLNPLFGFYAAISRLWQDGTSPHGPGGWYPSEHLSRTQALRGMTIDAAYASFSESTLGSLEVGKKADFVVLSKDIMRVPINEVLSAKVQATVVDGRLEFGKL